MRATLLKFTISALLLIVLSTIALAHDDDPLPTATPYTGVVSENPPTYYKDILPILHYNCMGCHTEGGIGYEIFAMDDVEYIQKSASDIALVTEIGYMPPWLPGEKSPALLHDRRLTQAQINTLVEWSDANAPLGDPQDTPELVEREQPELRVDMTLELPVPYTPREDLKDDYRCFLIDPGFNEDTYVTGYDIIPDATEIVHHVIVYQIAADAYDDAMARDAEDDRPGWECFGGPGVSTGGGSGLRQTFTRVYFLLGGESGIQALVESADPVAEITEKITDEDLIEFMEDIGGPEVVLILLKSFSGDIELTEEEERLVTRSFVRLSQRSGSGIGNSVGTWAPGNFPVIYPEGIGRLVPEGNLFVVQMHYNLSAGIQTDQSQITLQIADSGEDMQALYGTAMTGPVEIPCPEGVANELCDRSAVARQQSTRTSDGLLTACDASLADFADQTSGIVSSSCDYTSPVTGWLISIGGHMHELGSQISVELHPDEPEHRILLDIPFWDFHWQGVYQLAEPIWVEEGDNVRLNCTWDNRETRSNPEPRYVVWGEGTSDEMCLALINVLPAVEGDPFPIEVAHNHSE